MKLGPRTHQVPNPQFECHLATAMVGVVMQSLLKHHDNVRRAKRSTWFSGINSREAASACRPSSGARLVEPYRGVSSGGVR